MSSRILMFIVTLLSCAVLSGQTAELAVGAAMPALELPDQHEVKGAVDKSTRKVVLVFEMAVAKQLNVWLDAKGKDYLTDHKTVYIADISGMPGPIAAMFGVPKMKKYSHRILLAREDDFKLRFPRKKDHATILHLAGDGTVEKVTYVAGGESLKTEIE